MEATLGTSGWLRIMGIEGCEGMADIRDKPMAERLLAAMKEEALKVTEKDLVGANG